MESPPAEQRGGIIMQMIERKSLDRAVLPALRTLADESFDTATIRRAVMKLGEQDYADCGQTVYRLPHDTLLTLHVGDDELTIAAAIVAVAAWENASADIGSNDARIVEDRAVYDSIYEQLLSDTSSMIGPRDLHGVDRGPFRFQWSLWHGATGVMVVQQSLYDYMPDINIWVRPHGTGPMKPTDPFVDWLMSWR
jgi:hypothetical protein